MHALSIGSMSHAPPSRRRALALVVAAGLSLAGTGLTGCGFQLRQPPRMAFRTVALTGFSSSSPMATELARALEAAGVDVVEDSAQAAAAIASKPSEAAPSPLAGHVILESLTDQRDQIVASTTAFGQVRDLTLRTRLTFRLLRADGSVLIAPTELALSRDLTYNEKDALAKQDEAEALHRAMQADLIAQVLRRCAVVRADQLTRP